MVRVQKLRLARWYVVLVLMIAGIVFWRWTRPEAARVVAATVLIGDVEDTVSTTGTVSPLEEFEARSSYPATVQKIHIELGQHVRRGQLLVTMKDPFADSRVATAAARLQEVEVSLENVQHNGSQEDRINIASDLDRAEAEHAGAQGSLDTLEKLASTGDASTSEIAAARGRLRAANEALKILDDRKTNRYSVADRQSWNARVAEAKASLEAEKANLSNTYITSPIAGVAYLIPVAQYDFVPAGADLVNVADLNNMKVTANFDEPDIGKLHEGQRVSISWDGKPGRLWHGYILRAPLAVAAQGQRSVGECSISVDDAHEDLPAHITATVKVLLHSRSNVLTLPHEAVQNGPSGFFVYRILNGELVQTPVSVGVVSIDRIEITKGLSAGDRVALHLTEGGQTSNHLKVHVAE